MMLFPWRVMWWRMRSRDRVDERAEAFYPDADFVAAREGEIIRRHDAGAGQQIAAVRKRVVAEKKRGELGERPFHLAERRFAAKNRGAIAPDFDLDFRFARQRLAHHERRAEAAARAPDLGLRKVERVLAFDVAPAEIVSGGGSKNGAARIDRERQLRLGHVPFRIRAQRQFSTGSEHAMRRRLEKNLRPLRLVHAIVKAAAARVLALVDPRVAAAEIRHAGGPDFLALNRREQLRRQHERLPRATPIVLPAQ